MATNTDSEKLRDLVKGKRFCMFTTLADDGTIVSRPMTVVEDEDWVLRFITQADNDVALQSDGKQVNLAIVENSTYISLSGVGTVVHDLAKKQELWGRLMEAYAGPAEDPNNVILEIAIDSGEYWDGGNPVLQVIGLAKAALTGEPPQGDHGTV